MNLSQVHYLPLAPPFFLILVGLFVILLVLIQLGALRYAYMRLGISSGAALFCCSPLSSAAILIFRSCTCRNNGYWPSRRSISSECVMSFHLSPSGPEH